MLKCLRTSATLGLLLFTTRAGAEPVTIRLAWVTPVATWGSVQLEKKDLAKHLGRSYVLEPVRFQGTPLMITAMANGRDRQSRLFKLRARGSERPDERPAGHR